MRIVSLHQAKAMEEFNRLEIITMVRISTTCQISHQEETISMVRIPITNLTYRPMETISKVKISTTNLTLPKEGTTFKVRTSTNLPSTNHSHQNFNQPPIY